MANVYVLQDRSNGYSILWLMFMYCRTEVMDIP